MQDHPCTPARPSNWRRARLALTSTPHSCSVESRHTLSHPARHDVFKPLKLAMREVVHERKMSPLIFRAKHRANKTLHPVHQPNAEGGVMLGLGPTPASGRT
ncbi:hypothetical protein SLEP1_g10100 [Rubroshorea leprosula]|uniref:Uncharacterized protein n=1 Tax=Rubroshorea leprosula TaxID=152421 RepID=A0AAV5IEZ7_9ROSI|nr:hypothetical protein SLEP1_g10100 [Rubroshorea leprosula]